MGCDIHDYAEVRINGVWQKVGKVFPNPYHRPEEPEQPPDEDGYVWNARLTDHPYEVRNYGVFAILANVRNGVGFAGCDTGNGYMPIALPRGLPRDVTPEVLKEYTLRVLPEDTYNENRSGQCLLQHAERWVASGSSAWVLPDKIVTNPDWHSASYLTLAELEEYNWEQVTVRRGVVDAEQYQIWKKRGKPEEWCSDAFGPEHVTNKEMERRIAAGETTSLVTHEYTGHQSELECVTSVEWREPYREVAKDFLERTLPALRALVPAGGTTTEDVRLVFWFDN